MKLLFELSSSFEVFPITFHFKAALRFNFLETVIFVEVSAKVRRDYSEASFAARRRRETFAHASSA